MAKNSRTVVYQSYIKRNENSNKQEKNANTNEVFTSIKNSLNKTTPVNVMNIEPSLEKKESSDSSSSPKSVKRISQFFEKDVFNENISSNTEKKETLQRKQKESQINSELQDKIKLFEIKNNSVNDAKKDLIKRKSESKIELRQTQETNRVDTQLSIALSKSKNLPFIEINESFDKQDTVNSSEEEKKNNIKNIWINNERNVEVVKVTQIKKALLNSSNEAESKINHRDVDESKDNINSVGIKNIPDSNIGSVKSIITQYQNSIEKNLMTDKQRKNNFNYKDRGLKKQSKDTVKSSNEQKPMEIDLIQNRRKISVPNDVNERINTRNDKKDLNIKTNTLPVTAVIEIPKSKNIETVSGDLPSIGLNQLIEKQAPSSSIKDIIRNANLGETQTSVPLKPSIAQGNANKTNISLQKKTKVADNTEKLSFKEELERKLFPKSGQIPTTKFSSTESDSYENTLKEFETKNKINKQIFKVKDESENPLVFKYEIGKKSKEEVMTDWVSVDDVVIKTRAELEEEIRQNEKKKMLNREFLSSVGNKNGFNTEISSKEENKTIEKKKKLPVHQSLMEQHDINQNENKKLLNKEFLASFGKKNSFNEEQSPVEDTPDYPMEDEEVNNNKYQNNHQNFSIDKKKESNNNTNEDAQLERFIAKHLDKQNKSSSKNSSKHGATRMKSHDRPNASEYFKDNESKKIKNGVIPNSALKLDVPAPDYD